jgi:D-alanyl-D-alanine carboxypeptidase (penicillin-binding protein 5/6)
MMNRQARRLGMDHTEFTNPSGLPDAAMHTTARDMATLARALTRDFPQYLDLFERDRIRHNGITQHDREGLLRYVDGARALMTGHTADSGYHLITVADREGRRMRLVGVILGASAPDAHFSGMQALINYAFRFYETTPIYAAGDTVRAARVWQGVRDKVAVGLRQDLHLTVPRRRSEALSVTAEMARPIRAPVAAGERLGWLRVALAGRNLAHRPLVARQAVPASGWLTYLMDAARLRWRAFWREQRQSLLADEGAATQPPQPAEADRPSPG